VKRDILSQGEDREPRSWPPRLASAAALAVVLIVVLVHYLPRHGHAQARQARAAATASPVPSAAAGFAQVGPGVPGRPDGIIGQASLRDGSLQLPIAGEQPAWFWPATGRTEPIGGLPSERAGYQFTRVGGGWVIQPSSAPQLSCGSCAGPPAPVYFLADQARAATRIGTADHVAPAATPGALWLTISPPTADSSTTAATAQEVSVAGTPLGPQFRLPAGYLIEQATDRGLLLAPQIQRGVTGFPLWQPGARRPSRVFPDGVVAASASEIAWTPRCASSCRVYVLHLASGRATMVRLPAGSSATDGAFSPDGDYLALQVSFGSGGDGGALAMQLQVASTATGHLTVVPGTWVSSDALVGFGWPGGGDRLVAELSFLTKVQVAAWRPGAARLAVVAIRRNQESATLIVG
jgi:hypothetical protein